jgi:choline-sulfatase
VTDQRPPNVLFLMADEHRADVAGYAGDAVVRTPRLDALAADGVVFDHCYTPSPICVPARQCLAAGQFPRTCGVERYGQDLPPGSLTFARWFAEHGYETVCCGKLHHLGPDQMQGWTQRPAGDLHHRPLQAPDAYRPPPTPPGSGKWSDAKEVRRAGIGRGPATHDLDTRSLNAGLDFIRHWFVDPYYDRPGGDRPLMLKISFNRPHYPYFTDAERFAYYLNRVAVYDQTPPTDHPFLTRHRVTVGEQVTRRDLRRATAAYYGMIDELDHDLGRVLDALAQVGQNLDDWIVVYTADHGEMLGQHGVWEKQVFYEGSARVPLIVRWPQKFGPRRVSENCSLCDLYATLVELAGLPTPPAERTVNQRGLDSRSLVNLMRGEAEGWPDEAVSQFGGTNLMIKRGDLKYYFYAGDAGDPPEHRELLYDLAEDPQETRPITDATRRASLLPGLRTRRSQLGF